MVPVASDFYTSATHMLKIRLHEAPWLVFQSSLGKSFSWSLAIGSL